MNEQKDRNRRRVRGPLSVALTAGVIALVLLLNVGVSALFGYHLWHIDTTSHALFTLTKECVNYLDANLKEVDLGRAEDDKTEVEIIFCSDPDVLRADTRMNYVYHTALEMEKAFRGTIRVSAYDIAKDRSAIRDYLTTVYSTVYADSIIVTSGSEFRIFSLRDMYQYDSVASPDPWAYDGEKKLARAIVAVTRAKSPLCAILTNHGGAMATEAGRADYSELISLVEKSGYDVVYLNLETEEIPADCRLILCMDPETDFVASAPTGTTSETKKLDAYLAQSNSLMLFVDADTPTLPNLEEVLDEWGVSFHSYKTDDGQNAGLQAIDPFSALDSTGTRIVASYETTALGGSILENLINYGQPKIVFDNARPLFYADAYYLTYMPENESAGVAAYDFAAYNRNGINRVAYELFTTGADAYAYARANGAWVPDDTGAPVLASNEGGYQLMSITAQNRSITEGKGYSSVNDASYVCTVGSTEMAKNTYLSSRSYGNADALLAVLRTLGQEVVSSGIELKVLPSSSVSSTIATPFAVTVWTVVLALLPAAAAVCTAVPILLRRRSAHETGK